MILTLRQWKSSIIIASTTLLVFYYLSTNFQRPARSAPISFPEPFLNIHDDGKVHWSKLPEENPVTSLIPLPTGHVEMIPKIQAPSRKENDKFKAERLKRLAAVKDMFLHSWTGYKNNAWLRDEVRPVSGGFVNTFGGWAATLVDSMDTLWLMGLEEEFELCVNAVEAIDFTTTDSREINVFETTIRYLGGFLAAYDISEGRYPILLTKAVEVGEMLMSVFDTPNRMPITRWNWKEYMGGESQEAPSNQLVAELGSLSLEFTRLAQLTGEVKYYDAIQRISNEFEESQMDTQLPGMWPVVINTQQLRFDSDNSFTLGGMSDSVYEYLPKQYMILGGLLDQSKKMYERFIDVAKKHIFLKVLNPGNFDLVIPGDARVSDQLQIVARGQHLTCFAGGMVAIASKIFDRPDELRLGAAITNGCVWAYDSMAATGVGPEIFSFAMCDPEEDCLWSEEKWLTQVEREEDRESLPKGFTGLVDKRYILRPEAIESVFIMYRITGETDWQDKAWRMFQAIVTIARTEIAATGIWDVTDPKSDKTNSMESFWLGETLKYFYLIFSEPNVLSLDEFVLNTEAHPLRRPT